MNLALVTSAGLTFCLLLACVKAKSPAAKSQVQEAPAPALRAYGGGLDFGIPFTKVTEAEAKEFWRSWRDPQSYSARILREQSAPSEGEASRVTTPNGEVVLVTSQQAQREALSLVRSFLTATKTWWKTACLEVDMAKASQGVLEPRGPLGVMVNSRLHPTCMFRRAGSDKTPAPPEIVLDPSFTLEFSPSRTVTNDAPGVASFTLNSANFSTYAYLSGNIPTLLEFSFGMEGSAGTETYFDNNPYALSVIGNYLVPRHSKKLALGFAVPVMKFESDPSHPNYLQPTAFFDFGALVLQGLPPRFALVTAFAEGDKENWDKKNLEAVGNLSQVLPQDLHSYATLAKVLATNAGAPESSERIPVGTLPWRTQLTPGTTHPNQNYAVVSDVGKTELLPLYLNESTAERAVWIATLDSHRSVLPTPPGGSDSNRGASTIQLCPELAPFTSEDTLFPLEFEVYIGTRRGVTDYLPRKPLRTLACSH